MTNSSDGSQGSANANANPSGIASVTLPMNLISAPPHADLHISRPGQVPAYTVDDVRAFFLTHPLMGGHARPGTTVTLNTVQFLSRGDAEKALRGESLQGQVAAGGIVCYLTFTGTFDLSSIHALPALDGTPVRLADAHHTHLVLDATTGRTLIWGLDEPLRDAP